MGKWTNMHLKLERIETNLRNQSATADWREQDVKHQSFPQIPWLRINNFIDEIYPERHWY